MSATQLQADARAIIADKNYVHLAVPREDGTILSVVLWSHIDDDDRILLNSAEGRTWPRLLRRAGRATLSWANAANPYEFVAITARVVDDTHEGAEAGIDALTKKYMGVDVYPNHNDAEQRVQFVLEPERVTYRGG